MEILVKCGWTKIPRGRIGAGGRMPTLSPEGFASFQVYDAPDGNALVRGECSYAHAQMLILKGFEVQMEGIPPVEAPSKEHDRQLMKHQKQVARARKGADARRLGIFVLPTNRKRDSND